MTDDCVISIMHFGFRRRGAVFICILTIQISKVYTIKNKKSIIVVDIFKIRVIGILITIVISNV